MADGLTRSHPALLPFPALCYRILPNRRRQPSCPPARAHFCRHGRRRDGMQPPPRYVTSRRARLLGLAVPANHFCCSCGCSFRSPRVPSLLCYDQVFFFFFPLSFTTTLAFFSFSVSLLVLFMLCIFFYFFYHLLFIWFFRSFVFFFCFVSNSIHVATLSKDPLSIHPLQPDGRPHSLVLFFFSSFLFFFFHRLFLLGGPVRRKHRSAWVCAGPKGLFSPVMRARAQMYAPSFTRSHMHPSTHGHALHAAQGFASCASTYEALWKAAATSEASLVRTAVGRSRMGARAPHTRCLWTGRAATRVRQRCMRQALLAPASRLQPNTAQRINKVSHALCIGTWVSLQTSIQ